jgi:hypothetical protein
VHLKKTPLQFGLLAVALWLASTAAAFAQQQTGYQ